jgi:hypothetical protein
MIQSLVLHMKVLSFLFEHFDSVKCQSVEVQLEEIMCNIRQ